MFVFIPGWYVVSLDGADPFIRWQMERGLDWTISSVAGESYRVDVSLWLFFSELMAVFKWKNRVVLVQIDLSELLRGSEDWTAGPCDACFTLKYYSDALFDFSHWFGFSKRAFKVNPPPSNPPSAFKSVH